MAAIISLSLARSLRRPIFSSISKHLLLKSRICPPSSSSFFHRLPPPPRTTILRHPRSPSFSTSTVAVDNPLLKTFEFPPFDAIVTSHVRPGILALLKELDGDLIELERTVEPTWPKLVEPLEKMKDQLSVDYVRKMKKKKLLGIGAKEKGYGGKVRGRRADRRMFLEIT